MSQHVEAIISSLALRDLPDGTNMLDLAAHIAKKHGVLPRELLSDSHEHAASAARHEFWFWLREQSLSYPRIGKLVDRDHTTVMSGIRKHLQRLCRVKPIRATDENAA